MVAVLRGDHPAADPEEGPIELRELAGASWIAAPAQTACGDAFLQACRSAGFAPRIRHICTGSPPWPLWPRAVAIRPSSPAWPRHICRSC
ncbi:LysR substrate-binding domain-containing protein [Streptomyces sp. TS71-3]|uniref:LysR substrate-binding domain-containing protein n=1 Tax=Streptomyces sp. TS71-3 TaxID=2733862 RepID=UPI001BB2F167